MKGLQSDSPVSDVTCILYPSIWDVGCLHVISTVFSFRILNFKSEGGSTVNKDVIHVSFCCGACNWNMYWISNYFIFQAKYFLPNDKHFTIEVERFVVGQDKGANKRRGDEKVTYSDIYIIGSHFMVKWLLFELQKPGNSWYATQAQKVKTQNMKYRLPPHKYRTQCKHWGDHTQHAVCNQFKACPTSPNILTIYKLSCIGTTWQYNVFIPKSLIIQWNPRCQITVEVGLTLCYITFYMLYIQSIYTYILCLVKSLYD